MRLLTRKQGAKPHAKSIRPAERYLTAGAAEARRLQCSFVGTEHVLRALAHNRASGSAALPGRLRADPAAVESALGLWLGPSSGGPSGRARPSAPPRRVLGSYRG